jgi:O-methyltransferase involved in polyketide biosynthesis
VTQPDERHEQASDGNPPDDKIPVALEGVPGTLLWTLYFRAAEAGRPDALLRDPKAVELVERLDYPFEERLGPPTDARAQWQALRNLCVDREIRSFIRRHPGGTVVALGEGLETQFWRVDDGRMRWLGVDLPETAALRARALPDGPRMRTVAASVLDATWMDAVESSEPVMLTAQGLLMYLQPAEARGLLGRCAQRFPGATMVFDAVPPWVSRRTLQGKLDPRGTFPVPPMPWAMDPEERRRLEASPLVVELRRLHPPRGRGLLHGVILPALSRVPGLRDQALLSIYRIRFAGPDDPVNVRRDG